MRKVRGDSVLLSQPEGVRQAILKLDTEQGMTLQEIKEKLVLPLDDGGFEIEASTGTISVFLQRQKVLNFRSRLQRRAKHAAEIEGTLSDEDRARIDQGIMDGLREIIFDQAASGEIDPRGAKALYGLILKAKEQKLDERKLALLEKKAAAFDEAQKVAEDDGLTPEERLAKIREGLLV